MYSAFPTAAISLALGFGAALDLMGADLPMYEMRKGVETEVIWTRVIIPARGAVDLAKLNGEGIISSIWGTFDFKVREKYNYLGRAIVLNMYWDGSAKPAVSVPLADFFGQRVAAGLGKNCR